MKNIKDKWSTLATDEAYKLLTFPKDAFKRITRECTEKQIDRLSGQLIRYLLLDEVPTFKPTEENLEAKWEDLVEEVERIVKKYRRNSSNISVKSIHFVKKNVKNFEENVKKIEENDDDYLPF